MFSSTMPSSVLHCIRIFMDLGSTIYRTSVFVSVFLLVVDVWAVELMAFVKLLVRIMPHFGSCVDQVFLFYFQFYYFELFL